MGIVGWAEGVDERLGVGGYVEVAVGPDAAVGAAGSEGEDGAVHGGAGEDVEVDG